jgi:hypothetical protein
MEALHREDLLLEYSADDEAPGIQYFKTRILYLNALAAINAGPDLSTFPSCIFLYYSSSTPVVFLVYTAHPHSASSHSNGREGFEQAHPSCRACEVQTLR